MTQLGERITKARNRTGETRAELALAAGCSQQQIRLLEQGLSQNPTVLMLRNIAYALGINPVTLAKAAIEDLGEP
jgi:transcriptional regulator with XRE-family HTH domain